MQFGATACKAIGEAYMYFILTAGRGLVLLSLEAAARNEKFGACMWAWQAWLG